MSAHAACAKMVILPWLGQASNKIWLGGKKTTLASHALIACCKQLPCMGDDKLMVLLF